MEATKSKVIRDTGKSIVYEDGSMDYFFDDKLELTDKKSASIIKHFNPDGTHVWLAAKPTKPV